MPVTQRTRTIQSFRRDVCRLMLFQIILMAMVGAVWLLNGWHSMIAAMLGGLISLLPGFYFAWRFSATTHARQVNAIMRAFYGGLLVKWLLTALLAVLVIKIYPGIALLPFITGVVVCSFSIIFAPLVMKTTLN